MLDRVRKNVKNVMLAMGCKGSKSKKNSYERAAQYQKESTTFEKLVRQPSMPLEWVETPKDCVSQTELHNLLTDGFYAPFIANPRYLLLIDCRERKQFKHSRLLTARWFADVLKCQTTLNDLCNGDPCSDTLCNGTTTIDLKAESLSVNNNVVPQEYYFYNDPSPYKVPIDFGQKCCQLEEYYHIVLYDDALRTSSPCLQDTSPLSKLYHKLRSKKLSPKVVLGCWSSIEMFCNHLIVPGDTYSPLTPSPHSKLPSLWYPAMVIPGFLYLGQDGVSEDPCILSSLSVTHVVSLSDVVPKRVLSSTNYLVVPLPDLDPLEKSIFDGPDLPTAMPTILAFVTEAKVLGGVVIVHGDQGLTRAAAVVMALLMVDRRCSLEDAFYFLRGVRGGVEPHRGILKQLVNYEISIFGTALTDIDDLIC